jgi:hypothetical protein
MKLSQIRQRPLPSLSFAEIINHRIIRCFMVLATDSVVNKPYHLAVLLYWSWKSNGIAHSSFFCQARRVLLYGIVCWIKLLRGKLLWCAVICLKWGDTGQLNLRKKPEVQYWQQICMFTQHSLWDEWSSITSLFMNRFYCCTLVEKRVFLFGT